ncbi:MAG: clan AA aspartic protease [Candidatus Rokubacteria bacterium]|nr:clan AA aspartic protease [Candidatus Rokubacteria bacterium]
MRRVPATLWPARGALALDDDARGARRRRRSGALGDQGDGAAGAGGARHEARAPSSHARGESGRHALALRGTLNGHRELVFILDTAASITSIAPETAARLGLQPTGAPPRRAIGGAGDTRVAPPVVTAALQIGDFVIDGLDVAVVALPRVGFSYDGVLGNDFLEHFRFTVDRKAGQMRLERTP